MRRSWDQGARDGGWLRVHVGSSGGLWALCLGWGRGRGAGVAAGAGMGRLRRGPPLSRGRGICEAETWGSPGDAEHPMQKAGGLGIAGGGCRVLFTYLPIERAEEGLG